MEYLQWNSLEIANFAKKGACGNDRKTPTKSPDKTAEYSDNFMSKKLIFGISALSTMRTVGTYRWEGNNEQNSDGYQVAKFETETWLALQPEKNEFRTRRFRAWQRTLSSNWPLAQANVQFVCGIWS
jgi:hypothetical protein